MATTGESATTEVKREVKVVKKQVKKEKKVENGDQNGESNIEAADLTVKLPTKKSAAKTETKVEVQKTILPDGTIEEVKTTTTKTTIDGKTEIKTKTEKTIIPKEETEEVEEEEEQEEESEAVVQEAEEESELVEEPVVVVKKTVSKETPVENGQKETIVKKEERSETSTTKKVVVVQKEESEEEEEEEEPVVIVKKSVPKPSTPKQEVEEEHEEVKEVVEKSQQVVRTTGPVKEKEVEEEAEEEVEEVEESEVKVERKIEAQQKSEPVKQEEEKSDEEVEEEYEEAEDKVEKIEKKVVKEEVVEESKKQEDEESEYTEEEYESEKEELPKVIAKVADNKPKEPEKEEPKEKIPEQQVEKPEPKEEKEEPPTSQPAHEPAPQPSTQPAQKVPLREASIPLEKVEDVEIKPIGPTSGLITKSHTENTEIITSSSQQPKGPLSTQTEYNRVENIVTVNRTTKTLDQSYDQITQTGIPTLKTYFAPNRERISTSPQPSKPYQPVYTAEPTTERRHSLLLDRLSVERQVPSSDIYQNTYQYNTNQSYEQQRQWTQEPQSEVINVSNVKPSKITNQQWYQQINKDNVIYNNVTPTAGAPAATSQPWSQSAPQPSQQYQPSYTENTTQEKATTNTYQQNNYPTYIPKPTNWVNSNADNLPSINTNKYSFLDTSENYQKSTQQYSSTYVPPPWEQDPNYVLNTSNQNYYQPPPQPTTYNPSSNQGWKSAPPQAKYTKPPPTSYIPPAPNQSFVKSVNIVEPPKIPGRKTYYSEYERRYITVPESTYIPGQTKFQAQPDPSPQYYYDNNEPSEKVEHEWRKELREFTEKTSQTTQHTTEQTSVLPPWEEDPKYAKTPSAYTPTPTWSQTLRPRSCRERSFESEYVGSQEFSKTNTLGRGRPLSSYGKEPPIPERVRGVSVDRYNPNNYQSPLMSEHGPVPTHTLTPTPPAKSYHNPNVPAYHTHPRASAEPREQPASYQQPRLWGVDSRGTPVQSRSFKYLQWITGTED